MTGDPVVVALAGTALFQDLGRHHRASGVPVGGAFDGFAHDAATRLVGGPASDASLEVTGSLELLLARPMTCAVTGSATVHVDGTRAPAWTALDVPAGARLLIRATGRAYLAVVGGFLPEPVLGSRSTCLMGPLGPAPVGVGDRLPMSPGVVTGSVGDVVAVPEVRSVLRAVPGPHLQLQGSRVTVVDASRIGVRLRPDAEVRSRASLASLGVLPGAIQVLPSGEWVVLGPDSGTMGGYPIIGVVATADLRHLAHVGAGDELGLVPVEAADAPRPPAPRVLRLGDVAG